MHRKYIKIVEFIVDYKEGGGVHMVNLHHIHYICLKLYRPSSMNIVIKLLVIGAIHIPK